MFDSLTVMNSVKYVGKKEEREASIWLGHDFSRTQDVMVSADNDGGDFGYDVVEMVFVDVYTLNTSQEKNRRTN